MDSKMSDDAYNKKLADLQKYIPFMENMIAQLKDPKWKPREAQLNKMESLYNMITDKNKKWKYETLLKCQEVILKLQSKVKANRPIFNADKKELFMNPERPDLTHTVHDIMNALKFNNARAKLNCEMATPKSPSPVRDLTPHSPKIIPFEATNEPIRKSTNIVDPNELSITWNIDTHDRYVNEKPDIYDSAAKSLGVIPSKSSVFDRLGPAVLDTSEKPLLSDADLEMLHSGDDFVVICQNQAQTPSKQEKSFEEINLKITPRIMPVPASKPKTVASEKPNKEEKAAKHSKKSESHKDEKRKHKDSSSNASKSPKTEKITISDMFGNCLSSIDNMILEDSKKKDKKKDERRHSGEHKKEKHRKHHESKHHHKHKDKNRDKEKRKSEESVKTDDDKETSVDAVVEKSPEKVMDAKDTVQEEKVQISESQPEKPKRLADKYNPKPRKHVEGEVVEKNSNDGFSFENRDPRRKPASLLGTPLCCPPVIPALNALPLSNTRNMNSNIPAIPSLLSTVVQQPTISPPQTLPLMALNIQPPPRSFQSPPMQSWLNENQDFSRPFPSSIFDSPKLCEPRRPSFHQDNPDRIVADPRRQPKFSPPPPPISPVNLPFANNFVPTVFNNQPPIRNDLNFIPPPIQRNNFDSPLVNYHQSRFEPPPSNRFEPPVPNAHASYSNTPRRNFCPFEPLDKDKDREEEFQQNSNQTHRRNENQGGFRNSYGQYNNNNRQDHRFDRNFDRYGRKIQRDAAKISPREDKCKVGAKDENEKFKYGMQEESNDKQSSKGSDSDIASKEPSQTKYDEIYSKLDNEKETFVSPLEALYSNSKASVKCIQSFKIPKKPKPEPSEELKKEMDDAEKEAESKEKNSPKDDAKSSVEETGYKSSITTEGTDSEDDDVPLWKRIKRRTKTMKKKVIVDSEEEKDCEDEEEKEEENFTSTRRATRRSAIIANRLITKKKNQIKTRKKAQNAKSKDNVREEFDEKEFLMDDENQEEDPLKEEESSIAKLKTETTEGDDNNSETNETYYKSHIETKDENEIKLDCKEDEAIGELVIDKENKSNDVRKAKEELLNEAKKKNLNLNDQGAEVLQFILMNYKKIKKIFKSDSSSDEEEKEKKKKKKKREKSSSDDEKGTKEKRKHKEKYSSGDEREEKQKRKKDKSISDDENEDMSKNESPLSEVERDEDTEKDCREESSEKESIMEEKLDENAIDENAEFLEEIDEQPSKKIKKKKMNPRKGKVAHKKVPKRITRNQALVSVTKKARRSELDKLHDDIKEMLMGGEVLTSTGKRACTLPKDDFEESKRGESSEDQSSVSLDQNSLAEKSAHLCVLLEKTDLAKLLPKEPSEDVETKEDDEINLAFPPKLERMVPAPVRKVKKRKILRKKKKYNKWASGIIGRKNKRKISSSEDKADETDSVKSTTPLPLPEMPKGNRHDKNYFTDGSKSYCKLCSFKGKLIIQHYKTVHANGEVIISRMDPGVTEHLINESKQKNLQTVVVKDTQSSKKKRFGYKCPFMCPIGTTIDFFENYYDHITSHTGEYRYFCPFCSFSTSNPRNLRAHMVPQHNSNLENYGKPVTPAPPASKYVFGYVCRECNYVQTIKENLEKHVLEYHNNKAEIIKINLSLICMEHDDQEPAIPAIAEASSAANATDHVNECIESVVHGAGLIKTPEPSLVKDLNIFDLRSQIEADDLPPILVKEEPIEPEIDLQILDLGDPPNRPNNPDLTVFMCKSDLMNDDEQTIDEKRLKKMNEIQENVRSARTSIADKLQSKLETTAQEETILATSKALTPPPSVTPLKPPPLIPIDRSKKSLDPIPKNLVPPDVVMGPKKAAPISNIINRLQDKLQPAASSSKSTSVSDDREAIASTSSASHSKQSNSNEQANAVLQIGPITITSNRSNDVLYSCFVPCCVFNTMCAQIFETHCKVTHKDFVYSRSKCEVCNIKIDHEDDFISMHDIYQHISSSHSDFISRKKNDISNTVNDEPDVSESKTTGCEVAPLKAVPNVISQADSQSGSKYPFIITSVTTVETKPRTTEFTLPHEVPNLISQADGESGPKFPFIITSVTSLAKKPPFKPSTPPLSVSPMVTTLPIITSVSSLASKSNVSILSTVSTIPTVSPIQTSPAVKPYTITSVQPGPTIVPIILNPLAPENDKSKIQLPVISCVQSLAPARKDVIRPKPLNQLTASTVSITDSNGKVIIPRNTTASNLNVISLVNSEGKTLTLKDIPLTVNEKNAQRKSKAATQALLAPDVVVRFYKCPQFFCSFSSDKANELVNHMSVHTELNNTSVHCLYCDYKTPYKMYVIHLELQHANCEYGCGYCFYRATNGSFVVVHSNVHHKERQPLVVKTPRENMPARINQNKLVPIKSILKHYVCGQPGCHLKTIFSGVFYDHILTAHQGVSKVICGICNVGLAGMNTHWASHGVHAFHCRYCPMGSKTLEGVVKHQAMVHYKNDYCVIFRKFVPNPNFPERDALSYTVEDDASYDRLFMLYGGGSTPNTVPDEVNLNDLYSVQPNQQQQKDADPIFLEVDLTEDTRTVLQENETVDTLLANDANVATTSDEPEIPLINTDLDEDVTDPLSFDIKDSAGNFSDGDSNDEKDADLDPAVYDKNAVKHNEEYTGALLYKCICNMRFEDKVKFKVHIVACQGDRVYKCAHCGMLRKSVRTLLTHMNEHGRKRFKCSLCQYKHFSKRFVRDHMNVEHNVHEMMILPATVTKRIDYSNDDFVLRPKLSAGKKMTIPGIVIEPLGTNKSVFFPKEIDQLPRPPIYQTDVFCAVCNYATKVKSNMVRHLQAHQSEQKVPETAPVNPVPCLEKSEKMFDKMVNLAMSSHSTGRMGGTKNEKSEEVHIPMYIPINKRFVCGADGCNYLCPEEGMLRRHLTTFHSQELNYTCLHCNMKLFEDKVLNLEYILKHLKLHDNHLYACGSCRFIHNLKHKVERHLTDKHADKPASLIIIREVGKEGEIEGTLHLEKEESKKPWRCGMCKFKCNNTEEVKAHIQIKHNVEAKHKCALCEFGSEDISSFGKHFETTHQGQTVDMIVSYYKEEEVLQQKPEADPEFNTTPLWQRNKSVKHIRGILLEETSNKTTKGSGPKKSKFLKKKNADNTEPKTELTINIQSLLKSPHSLMLGESKKPQPKRRKSKATSNKLTAPVKVKNKKSNSKNLDNEIILISNSDEDNPLVLDNIKSEDIKEKQKISNEKKNDLNPIIIEINKKGVKNVEIQKQPAPSKIIESFDEPKPEISEIKNPIDSETSSQAVRIDEISNPKIDEENREEQTIESSQIIEISDVKEFKNFEAFQEKTHLFVPTDKKSPSPEPSIQIIDISEGSNDKSNNADSQTSILDAPVIPKINLDDSSTEDSDVIVLSNESDVPSQSESRFHIAREEIPIDEAITLNEEVDSSLKNIKVVSVCSLKGEVLDDFEMEKRERSDDTVELIDLEEIPMKRPKLDISISEIETMNKEDLLDGNFVGTYGPYGSPWKGNFKCPLCEKFLCTSSEEFMTHIYQELQYGTYKCSACDYRDMLQSKVIQHHKESHSKSSRTEKVIMAPDQQIVDWVAKLIVFQSRIITLDHEWSDVQKLYCSFCEYRCSNPSDMRKHQVRHWANKPYSCMLCKYEAIQKSVIGKHIKRSHPNAGSKIIKESVTDKVVIKRIRWNGRNEKPEDGSELYEMSEMENDIGNVFENLKDVLLSCCYCYVRGNVEELKTHIKNVHPNKVFKVYRYKCNYCASNFVTLKGLEQHFNLCHFTMARSYSTVSRLNRTYQCPECPVTDDKLSNVKEHVRTHYKTIKCIHCNLSAIYWKTLRKHYREAHPVEPFEFYFLLTEDDRCEEALSQIKVAPMFKYLSAAAKNTKKRKRDSDDNLTDDTIIILPDETSIKEQETAQKVRVVARKSTGTRKPKEIESHYGKKPDCTDFANIITTVDVMGTPVTMNIIKLAKILDISPIVLVEDCGNDL